MRDSFSVELACFERAYFLYSRKDLAGMDDLEKEICGFKANLLITNRAYIALKNLVAELKDILKEELKNGRRELCNEQTDGVLPEEASTRETNAAVSDVHK